MSFKPIIWFSEIRREDIDIIGSKALNLGLMYNLRLPVPSGFIITAHAYKLFLENSNLNNIILSTLNNLDIEDTIKLGEVSKKIQEIILDADMPEEIKVCIIESYEDLNVNRMVSKALAKDVLNSLVKSGRELPFVAVRNSASLEDLQGASFPRQHSTYLNVRGRDELLLSVQKCWASLFNEKAIYYRKKNNISNDNLYISVIVQKMIQSEKSGVIFSSNPITNEKNELVIKSVFGLGEVLIDKEVTPDMYIVDKTNFKIKSINVSNQPYGIFKDLYTGRNIKNIFTVEKGNKQKLSEEEIVNLSKFAIDIEKQYEKPMDIEWAIESNKYYILQTRPIITLKKEEIENIKINNTINYLLKGLGVSPGVITGKVKIIKDINEINKIENNNILVTKMTSPDMVPAIKKAIAIITDEGGMNCHAAILSKDIGIVCVIGTGKATEILKDGQIISVDGNNGEIQLIEDVRIENNIINEIKEEVKNGLNISMNIKLPEILYDEMKKYNIKWDDVAIQSIIEKIIMLNGLSSKSELLKLLSIEKQNNIQS